MGFQIVQKGLDRQIREDFYHRLILNLKFQLLYVVKLMCHLASTIFHASLELEFLFANLLFLNSNATHLVQMRCKLTSKN